MDIGKHSLRCKGFGLSVSQIFFQQKAEGNRIDILANLTHIVKDLPPQFYVFLGLFFIIIFLIYLLSGLMLLIYNCFLLKVFVDIEAGLERE